MRHFFSVLLLLCTLNSFSQNCVIDTISSVCFSMDACEAFFNSNSPADYSEFTGDIVNGANGPIFSVVGGNIYRPNPQINTHSCTPGVINSAICVSSQDDCTFVNGTDKAVQFDIQVVPGTSGTGAISCLSFYEAAPLMFNWNSGASGVNNYPTKYGVRVTVNGVEVFKQIDIDATSDWTLESFNFNSIPAFTVTQPTTFHFELLGYCTVGNGGLVNAWDIDELKVLYKEGGDPDGGVLTTNTGANTITLCEGDALNTTLTNQNGDNFAWVVTNAAGDILSLPSGSPFSFTANNTTCFLWHLAYETGLTGLAVGQNAFNMQGCYDFSQPITVIKNTNPDINSISSTHTSCGNNTGALTANVSNGTGNYNYLWSNGATSGTIINLSSGTYTVTVTDSAGCSDVGSATISGSTNPIANISKTNTSCGVNNGSAIASATSGTGGYTYVWSNGATTATINNLSPGTYTVTVKDSAGCTDTATVTIGASTSPIANINSKTDTSCGVNNGSATASATSGTGGYTYSWSNGGTSAMISNLSAGTYTVTVTDNVGCTDTATVTIGASTNPVASINKMDTTCGNNDGAATGSATSGTGGYVYTWSNGVASKTISNLSAGTYTLTVTDSAGCTDTETVTIGASTNPVASITKTDTTCGSNNGSATASATSGTGGYSYSWSNGGTSATISNLSAGTYTVTVTDSAGCTDTETVTIGASTNPVASITKTDTTCGSNNGSATASATSGTGGYSYSWSNGGTSATISNLSAGTYTVTVTDSAGCTDTETVTIGASTNPVASINKTNTSCGNNNGSATASATSGTGGYSYSWSNGGTSATISNLSAGTYTVTVTDSAGCTDTETVTIGASTNPVASINKTNTSCGLNNGSATASATSGTGGYSYVWSNGGTTATISNLSAGTYTVTVTDSAGCTDTETVTIGASTNPVASITKTDTTCGSNNGSATASATSGTGGYSYVWSNGGTTATISNLSAGTYTVTVTDSAGCTDTDTVTIGGSTNPVASINKTDTSCGNNNGSATASATSGTGGYSYSWSKGGTSATISNLSAGTYTVTVTDSAGCTDTETVTIGASTNPVASITKTDTTCGSNNGSATASATSGTGGYSYSWSNGGTSATISNLSAGTYTVTVTDSAGCTDTETVTIGASTNPVASINKTDTSCGNNNGSATASATSGTGGYSYSWSNGGTSATISNLSAGTYTVTVTDSAGCTDTETVTIGASTNPVASITKTDTTCGSNNGSATASATSGTGGYSYSWSNGGTSATISNLSAGTYTVTVTDSAGCTDTETVTIGASTNPVASINKTNTSCGNNNGSATASATSGTGGYSYSWSNGGTSATISNLSAGTYTVTVTDSAGCTDTETVTIGASTNPVASITKTDTTCGSNNGSATASATSGTGGYSYSWSNGGTSATISNLSAGTYTVTVTDSAGCTDTETVTIGASTNPVASITKTDTTCGSNNGSATASATSGTGGYSYSWSNGGTSATISNLSAGTYTVTVTDSAGCTDTETVTIGASTNPVASINKTNTSCGNNNGSATASATSGTGGYSYSWSNGGTSATISNLSAGTYTVTVTDSAGCTDTETVTIGASTNPVASINKTNTSCGLNNGSATASATSGTGGYSYVWSNGGTTATISNLSAGTYTVTVTDSAGCTDTETLTIGASTNPVASINKTDTSCGSNNGTATASATSGTGGYSYVWSNGGTTATISNLSAGTYTVTVTDSAGCTDTETVTIGASTNPVASINKTDTSCGLNNGSATASATSGTGGYSYVWSNGGTTATISNLSAGTYTVTVTDSAGCTDTETVTIGASTNPVASINKTDTSCGSNNGSATASATSGTGGYSYVWSNGGTTATISNLSAGTYTVTVTDSAGCTDTETVTIGASTNPVASINKTDTSCGSNNGSATASATSGTGGYSYVWSNGGTTATISNLSAGTYTVTVADSAGCTDTETVTIGGSTNPVASIAKTDTSCGLNNGTATASATNGTGGYSYVWSNGGTTATISNLSAGTYTVTVTDSAGCVDVEMVDINLSIPLEGSLSKDDTSCDDNNGSVSVIISSGNAPYEYSWSNGATSAIINNLSPGIYSVTITDSENCFLVGSIEILDSDIPIANITKTDTSCGANNGSATASATSGTGSYTYSWSNGANTATISNLSSGTYTITVTDSAGCTDTETVTIGGSINPVASINKIDTTCGSNNGLATASATSGTGGYSYVWSNGGTTATINNLSAGTYTVTVTDSAGCTDTETVTIGASTNPIASINKTDTSCGNNNGTATASATSGTGGYSYVWSNGGTTATISNLSAGTYTVTVTDSAGCTDTETVTIGSSNGPTVSLNASDTACSEANGSVTANASSGTSPYTYAWSNGGTTATISNLAAGIYSVTVTDAVGCIVSGSEEVGSSTSPLLTVNAFDTRCGENNGFANTSVELGSGVITYLWSNGATTSTVNGLAPGNYSLTVTDADGCSDTASFTIAPSTFPLATITGVNTTCGLDNGFATVVGSSGTGVYEYAWDNGATTATISNLSSGIYSVTLVDSDGCSDVKLVQIEDSAIPVVTLNAGNTTCGENNGTVTASVTSGAGGYVYTWSNGMTGSVISNLMSGSYSVTVVDADGCIGMSTAVTVGSSTNPIVSLSATPTTCGSNNGSITASTTNGTGGYSYSWSTGATGPTISNLSVGSYSVTVTDGAGCIDVATISINGSDSPIATITGTNTTCVDNNGSAMVSATGGSGGYTYLWSNGGTGMSINNLAGGTYSVTVTDNQGCTDVESIVINVLTGPSVGGTVFEDLNNDGCQAAAGDGVAGVTVTLLQCNANGTTTIISSTVTAADGSYEFGPGGANDLCLDPALTYQTSISNIPSGYNNSTGAGAGCAGDEDDSPLNDGVSSCYNPIDDDAVDGNEDEHIDFGISPCPSLGGTVFADVNNDGCQVGAETGVAGVTVTISQCNANGTTTVLSSTVTAADGSYEFGPNAGPDNLCLDPALTYQTSISNIPSGYNNSTGAGMGCAGNEDDSPLNDGVSTCYNPANNDGNDGNADEHIDFGIAPCPSLGGTVFADLNNNGCQGAGNGVAGVTVTISQCNLNGTTTVLSSTVTAADGSYEFGPNAGPDNLCLDPALTYQTSISNIPSGYNFSTGAGAGCAGDEDDSPLNDGVSTCYNPANDDGNDGDTDEHIDFGIYPCNGNGPVINIASVNTSCGSNNGSATANVSGGTGVYTYNWSNGSTSASITNLSAGTYSVTVSDNAGCDAIDNVTINASSSPSVTNITTNEICTNAAGTISVVVSGGSGTYSYNWSNGSNTPIITDLVAGLYAITVTDTNGCTVTASYSVVNETDLTIQVTGTETCCGEDNGNAAVTMDCGVAPYTINWSNGETTANIDNLPAGTYTVTVVDAIGDTETSTVVIQGSSSPNVTITGVNTFCGENNGSASIEVSAGLPPYTIAWSNGVMDEMMISDLAPGSYSVTVTDTKGCITMETIVIAPSILPNAGNLSGGPFLFCIDGSPDYVSGINLTNVVGTNTTFIITDANGVIISTPSNTSELENFNFETGQAGFCYIYHLSYEGNIFGMGIGLNVDDITGCYDLVGAVEVEKNGSEFDYSTVLFDMNACAAGVDFDEFTAEIDNYNGCTEFEVIGDNLDAGFSHSCTPGVNNSVGMCFSAEKSCIYDATTDKKLVINLRVSPGSFGTGGITGISFYEQAPDMFVWTDGTTGDNNYPTLFGIRILKNNVVIYEDEDLMTSQSWSLSQFDFSTNPDFMVTSTTTFTIELIPYCAVGNNSTDISIWDVDEINIYSECNNPLSGGELNGGPYDICLDGLPDFIDDLSITNNAGDQSILVVTDEDGNILHSANSMDAFEMINFDGGEEGTCYIWHISAENGFTGATVGNNINSDLIGCYNLSNSVAIVKTECGQKFNIYPNPTTDGITLKLLTPKFHTYSYEVVDNLGRVVIKNKVVENNEREVYVDLSILPAGRYYLKVASNSYRTTKPIIIVE